MSTTYPTPAAIPATQSDAELLNGITDTLTGLVHIAKGASPFTAQTIELLMRRREKRINTILASLCELQVVQEDTAGKIGIFPGVYRLGGVDKNYDGVTGQSIANGTWVLYLDANGTLQIVADATGWPANKSLYFPLARVTAAAGVVTLIQDMRNLVIRSADEPVSMTTVNKSANYTLTVADSGLVYTNYGSFGTITFTLPTTAQNGMCYRFIVAAAQTLEILPGSTDKILYSTAADNKKIYANTIGNTITIVGLSTGDWAVIGVNGTWSVQS